MRRAAVGRPSEAALCGGVLTIACGRAHLHRDLDRCSELVGGQGCVSDGGLVGVVGFEFMSARGAGFDRYMMVVWQVFVVLMGFSYFCEVGSAFYGKS